MRLFGSLQDGIAQHTAATRKFAYRDQGQPCVLTRDHSTASVGRLGVSDVASRNEQVRPSVPVNSILTRAGLARSILEQWSLPKQQAMPIILATIKSHNRRVGAVNAKKPQLWSWGQLMPSWDRGEQFGWENHQQL